MFGRLEQYVEDEFNQVRIAEEARRILETDAFTIAVQSMRNDYLSKWDKSSPEQVKYREHLKLKYDVVSEVLFQLECLVAEAEIQKQQELENDRRNQDSIWRDVGKPN
jgi:hypothetical protein